MARVSVTAATDEDFAGVLSVGTPQTRASIQHTFYTGSGTDAHACHV